MTPREMIHQVLADTADFVSAQMLHARLLVAGRRIGLNTVYRALRELVDTGKADMIRDPHGGRLYRLRTGTRHSHYLFCRTCGYSVPIESDLVEHWARTTGEAHGFTDVQHTIELVGVCDDCAANTRQPNVGTTT
jgi:Fur family transcriptional regulator, ferric uptake regulator